MKALILRHLSKHKADIYGFVIMGVLVNIPVIGFTEHLSGEERVLQVLIILLQISFFVNFCITAGIANSHVDNMEKVYLNNYPVKRGEIVASNIIIALIYYMVFIFSYFIGAYIINLILPSYNFANIGFEPTLFIMGSSLIIPFALCNFGLVFKFGKKGNRYVFWFFVCIPVIEGILESIGRKLNYTNIITINNIFYNDIVVSLFKNQALTNLGFSIFFIVGGFLTYIVLKKIYEGIDLERI